MPFYIKDPELGLFVGECLGLGFYEAHKGEDISNEEQPIPFNSKEEAQKYLDSWSGGIPKRTEIIFKESI